MPTSDDPHYVSASYSALASAYVDLFGSPEQAEVEDRELIAAWASQLDGPVLDAGCGPGHWTQFIADAHRPATGVDLVQEFLDFARRNFQKPDFLRADLAQLPFEDQYFSGVLSWYSVIHAPPAELPRLLDELARVLQPRGKLLLGFFAGDQIEAFGHQVAPAWYWPPEDLELLLEQSGFSVLEAGTRARTTARTHGHLSAQKTG
ncbi:class I SAM-dependent methyltransferase [Glutamicibacter sp.]|uniref:class I SAM-dependent methyltransferase n=1 Tax=Glutamicibacter sp. TaxID=1931995 RepID=UPI003D6A2CAE